MIHINLNMIFYTHVEHSPTKTIYIKYYKKNNKKPHYKHTHVHTHTHIYILYISENQKRSKAYGMEYRHVAGRKNQNHSCHKSVNLYSVYIYIYIYIYIYYVASKVGSSSKWKFLK